MELEVRGIKRVGHRLKKIMPKGIFTRCLLFYHFFVHLLIIPRSYIARKRVCKKIKEIRMADRPIRFGFYVVLESMFQWRRVFELMLEDKRFSPFIVVVPRVGYQRGDMSSTVEKGYESLVKKYGANRVFKGECSGRYDNYIDKCDACSMMNLYRGLAEPMFESEHFALAGIPIFASGYGYYNGNINGRYYFGMPNMKYVYKLYFNNEVERHYFYDGHRLSSPETEVIGCSKTDSIHFHQVSKSERKTILVAPHHSVISSVDNGFCIGNFLQYKDFLLRLPRMYPEVDWVLRPHPHLKLRLTKDIGWSLDDWENYIRAYIANPNAEYEDDGSYYDSFERSDAIIQDCASFLAEYFYTGKPCCYMLASEKAKAEQFDEWGQELLEHTYQAFDENAIIRFIEDVVIAGNDTMKERRQKFAKERVMINYPHASEAIVEDIANILGRGKKGGC